MKFNAWPVRKRNLDRSCPVDELQKGIITACRHGLSPRLPLISVLRIGS
jgi:hypothetical protein